MIVIRNAFGLPVYTKDVYGVEMSYKYDPMNRLVEFKGPYNIDWTIKNEYFGNRKSITKHNLGNGKILYTSMLTDGLGRVIQTKKEILRTNQNNICVGASSPSYTFAVSGDVIYDEFGRSTENYLTSQEVVCSNQGGTLEFWLTNYFTGANEQEKQISRVYDHRNRITQELVYGTNALTKTKYSFGPDKYGNILTSEEVALPEGNTTVSYINKLGQITSQKQVGRGEELWTSFNYDNLGQTIGVKNALEQLTIYNYDRLGQVVDKTLPASGVTSFEYDSLGNLINKTDAEGNIVNYEYNFNRLMRINHPSIYTKYIYDQGGRIIRMEDNSGYHEFVYGALGEVIEDNKMVLDQYHHPRYFKTKYKYDSWGRIFEIIYPDREKVFYNYNRIGQLEEIYNDIGEYYLKEVKYNYLDQPIYIKYGNDVEMHQEYDLTERLRSSQLSKRNSSNSPSIFNRNVYHYDKNNNIITMYNDYSQHNSIHVGGIGVKNYEYDLYNRLVSSNGNWEGLLEKHSYSLKMSYLKDHSIENKNQSHVIYDNNTGQIIHSDNSVYRGYTYDSNTGRLHEIQEHHNKNSQSANKIFNFTQTGNLSRIDNSSNFGGAYHFRDIEWDANNNITKIIDNQGEIVNEYIYDGKQERVIKRVNGGNLLSINGGNGLHGMYGANEVIYPSGNIVYNAQNYTKHYYSNGKRIASRVSNSLLAENFENNYFNNAQVSPLSLKNSPTELKSSNKKLLSTNILFSPTDCEAQISILLNIYYNSSEMSDCKAQILSIIEKHKILILGKFVTYNYCSALEEINTLLCIKTTEDGKIIDPTTGYAHDPLTGLPYDPITGLPIDMGTYNPYNPYNPVELDCYNKFLLYIDYYKNKNEKPIEYDDIVKYLDCIQPEFEQCFNCSFYEAVIRDNSTGICTIDFCKLDIPDLPTEPEAPVIIPEFPEIVLDPGIDDTWQDMPPPSVPIIANPLSQDTPVWWYHSDHLGSSTYITDIFGKPCQYIEYLPFGEVMVEQSTNNIFENVYKFNGKELDESTGYYYYGARYYDPGASIFLSVDPLAEKMPNYSPYNYTLNNPINFVDPDGRIPYPITIRSFAPFKTFGGGFHGDNRGYSTSGSASARVHQRINFDTDKNSMTLSNWSSPTWHSAAPGFKRTAKPSGGFTSGYGIFKEGSDKNFSFSTSYAGANPLTPGAPNIDVASNFYINENKEKGFLQVRGALTGDNFPSTESFITDPSGQSVFLGIGLYEGSPFTSLSGENERPITEFNVLIKTGKDGNFEGVYKNDGSDDVYSIKEWNSRFEKTDPNK